MLGDGEAAFFCMFIGFAILIIIGILANLGMIPGAQL